MNAIVPIPKCDLAIRVATMEDLPFLDALQKKHTRQLGYFPTKQFEGYIEMGAVLVAEKPGGVGVRVGLGVGSEALPNHNRNPSPNRAVALLGYVISRDRYLKRDELGVIYQLCVEPGTQRKLVGAALVKEVFERSAYGCRLYCCWCAQDLEANRFWESLGFAPIAFRAGSTGKKRVHIFWQKRIRQGDAGAGATPWWFPSQTTGGAIREDRLVLPIPPGVHWSEVKPLVLAESAKAKDQARELPAPRPARAGGNKAAPVAARAQAPTAISRVNALRFVAPTPPAPAPTPAPALDAKAKGRRRKTKEKTKCDPKLIAAARELRDRYLERVNAADEVSALRAKYDLTRALPEPPAAESSPAHRAHRVHRAHRALPLNPVRSAPAPAPATRAA